MKNEIKFDFKFYLSALRELSEIYIEDKNYDNLAELFPIIVEEILRRMKNEKYDAKYKNEIDFYLKYSGYDQSDFIDKFSKLNNRSSDEYKPSYFINTYKFHNSFSKEFKKIKKEKIY